MLSTGWDIASGISRAKRIARAQPIAIVHARSYVPAVIASAVSSATGAKFLFDMRGFWVDEKVEAGSWTEASVIYRVGKWFERRFLERADGIVSLTREGVKNLPRLGFDPRRAIPIDVIPTCVDTGRFVPEARDPGQRASLGFGSGPVVGCVGTLSNRYLRRTR